VQIFVKFAWMWMTDIAASVCSKTENSHLANSLATMFRNEAAGRRPNVVGGGDGADCFVPVPKRDSGGIPGASVKTFSEKNNYCRVA